MEYWPPFQLHSLNSPRDEFCVLDVEARDLLAVASGGRDPEKNAYSLQHCNISLQYAPSGKFCKLVYEPLRSTEFATDLSFLMYCDAAVFRVSAVDFGTAAYRSVK